MRVNFADVQRNVSEIANRDSYSKDVLFELLAAYGRSAAAITKLRNGINNLAEDQDNNVLQRGIVYFKHIPEGNLLSVIDKLDQDTLVVRYNPRYLIATNYNQLVAKDTKKGTTLDIKLQDIDRHVDFFYGWTGDEITDEKTEAVADRRAADKMKELYYEIEKVNRHKLAEKGSTFRHELNVFFTRLLFCFFAEDTKVFSKEDSGIFTKAIKDYTQIDGSDLDQFLETLFKALDNEDKSMFTSPFSKFPYVNGTLFDTKRNIAIPKFSPQARKYILDCGSLNWSKINPDIFGSMFQSIVDEDQRSVHGMHYTSVPNIMKTIEPLFLDELREEFDKYYDNTLRLTKLHDRIAKIKIFDPACGSGNFLIIAYKELRKLEHAIIDRLYEDDFKKAALAGKLSTRIDLDNFYGIEIDDFACEVAVLSLYLAKHQMNIDFEKQFGKEIKLIPLKDKANIVKGNAARLDWRKVCPNEPRTMDKAIYEQSKLIEDATEQSKLIDLDDIRRKVWDEIYLISNPPYQGAKLQTIEQKDDYRFVFEDRLYSKNLDYISLWFIKGADYIKGSDAQLAFVSTNSISQGDHVGLFWPHIFSRNIEIGFAHTSFKWSNLATGSAGVTCIVVSLRNPNKKKPKYIITEGIIRNVSNINPYLAESTNNTIVYSRKNTLSSIPKIVSGSMPRDGGFLILDKEERDELIANFPNSSKFIKRYVGSQELIKGIDRYCIWLTHQDYAEAESITPIYERLMNVKASRQKSKAPSTQAFADKPYRFVQISYKPEASIVLPLLSSEKRRYIPTDLFDKDTVISNLAFAIYSDKLYLFAILSSVIHKVWVEAVGGKMETRVRVSADITYNNFPIQPLIDTQVNDLDYSARQIIFARENHSEKTLAEMYDPDKMPEDLREAHHRNDQLIDGLYRKKPYDNDGERLADLFALYEQMILTEKEKTNA